MKRIFFIKLLFIVVPYVLAAKMLIMTMYTSGELTSIETMIRRQKEDSSILYGPAYTRPNPTYKLLSAREAAPEVMALGSSRVLQFRSEFFNKNPDAFYNAGRGAVDVADMIAFLKAMRPGRLPDILITGLDQYTFNPNWNTETANQKSIEKHRTLSPYRALWQFRQFVQHALEARYRLEDIYRTKDPVAQKYRPVGLKAKAHGAGFRHDGSYCYGLPESNPSAWRGPEFHDAHARIVDGRDRFEYGHRVCENNITQLRQLLAFCEKHHILVIGFKPPYACSVLARMKKSRNYTYLEQLPIRQKAVFDSFDYPFFDFTDMSSFGSDESEAVNGFHGSDVAYLRIMIEMVNAVPALREYADISYLERKLDEIEKHGHISFSCVADASYKGMCD